MTRSVARPLLVAAVVALAAAFGFTTLTAPRAVASATGSGEPSLVATLFNGDLVVAGGRHFPAGSMVTLTATGGELGAEAAVTAGADGRFLVGYKVPAAFSGTVEVTARAGNASASVSYPVEASQPQPLPPTPAVSPTLSATPPSGPAGTGGTGAAGPQGVPGNWKLAFGDEFDGAALDLTKWQLCNPSFRSYCQPWNNELQTFVTATTNNPNVRVADGQLHLVATKDGAGKIYSGMVSTGPWPAKFGPAPAGYQGFSYTYGYYEGRVRIPAGNGFWPSLWELPVNGGDGWPGTGEYDVFEIPGNNPTEYHFTAHWGGNGGECGHPCSPQQATITDASQNWHTYGLDWAPNGLTWYVDGKKMGETITNPAALKNTPFFVIANLSVGGDWGPLHGGPDASTPFPASMDIDYLRVYQRG